MAKVFLGGYQPDDEGDEEDEEGMIEKELDNWF